MKDTELEMQMRHKNKVEEDKINITEVYKNKQIEELTELIAKKGG